MKKPKILELITVREWLQIFQEDLLEDRKNEKCQAEPIYYGIQDVEKIVTDEEHADCTEYYNIATEDSMKLDEIFEEYLSKEDIQELEDNGVIKKSADKWWVRDIYEFCEFLEEETDIRMVSFQEVAYVEPDTLFLTRKAAQKHLDSNRHHYSSKACTYAMTAWRSRDVEVLLWLLQHIDFKKSEIYLKEEEE